MKNGWDALRLAGDRILLGLSGARGIGCLERSADTLCTGEPRGSDDAVALTLSDRPAIPFLPAGARRQYHDPTSHQKEQAHLGSSSKPPRDHFVMQASRQASPARSRPNRPDEQDEEADHDIPQL